jgi:WD40 repeat protein
MSKPSIYTVGGTVQAGGGLYIARKADEDMLNLSRAGTFAYVLTSRQVGKSSLMVRTAEQLVKEGIRPVMVDLTGLGSKVTEEAWYLGLLTDIADKLTLDTDVVAWWRNRSQLGATQRLTQFFREVVLTKIAEPVVIFVDEIDSTLGLSFTDDFYAAIRFLYNSRATVLEFRRLSFVLIGVATPSDLISDPKRTPFNIGQRVDITDFTYEEALPLAEGLDLPQEQARQVLLWVMKWTGGHPYLTQRLCRVIAEHYRSDWTEAEVDQTVAETFLGKVSENDNNLQFVRDMLTKRAPDRLAVLSMYRDVRLSSRPVRDEEISSINAHLKLSGVVRRESGKLQVRNRIYNEVFNPGWIKEHWPVSWFATIPRSVKIATALVLILLIASLISLSMYAKAQQQYAASENARTAEQKKNLNALEKLNNELVNSNEAEKKARRETEKARHNAEAEAARARKSESAQQKAAALARRAEKSARYQAEIADSLHKVADVAKDSVTQTLKHVSRLRRTTLALSLTTESQRQQQQQQYERAALLARQAYLFNKREHGEFHDQVYEALRTALNYFQSQQKEPAGGPKVWRGPMDGVRAVAMTSDDLLLASGSDDGVIRVWDLQQYIADPLVLNFHHAGVRALAFSPDNKTLISAGDDAKIFVIEPKRNGVPSFVELQGHLDRVWALAISPNGQLLASAGAEGKVLLWNLRNLPSKPWRSLNYNTRVRALAFCRDGSRLASGGDDGKVDIFDLRDGRTISLKNGSGVKALCFSPGDSILAAGGDDGVVRFWNVRGIDGKPTSRRAHGGSINAMVFSQDGSLLATGSSDRSIRLWNMKEDVENPIVLQDHNAWVWTLAFSHNGNALISGSADRTIRRWITRSEILAEIVCKKVSRNLTLEEWHDYIGPDIPYEKTCPNLSAPDIVKTEAAIQNEQD